MVVNICLRKDNIMFTLTSITALTVARVLNCKIFISIYNIYL